MLNLGLIGFAQPWLLLALAALPALWLLLRITPPSPRKLAFPALLFLLGLQSAERTPARTPPWLLALRLLLAALLILALAGPLLNPAPRLGGSGPLLLVVDNGWAAAPRWPQRVATARELLAQAEREQREVVLLPTAPALNAEPPVVGPASVAMDQLTSLLPRSWPVDRVQAREAVARLGLGTATPVWLSDGLAQDQPGIQAASQLADELRRLGPLRIFAAGTADLPVLLRLPAPGGEQLSVTVERVPAGAANLSVEAVGPGGERLARAPLDLTPGAAQATASLELPADMRNRVARLELTPTQGAAGVVLLDERWRRRTVGLLGPPRSVSAQPLLSELYFIERALAPSAEIREGALAELMEGPLSLLVMADAGRIEASERDRLAKWMEDGGVLLRFAGPRLAASDDDLVPVKLRAGDRMLGGALSWSEPLRLAPFDPEGPFAGLTPTDEVRVSRQVLAEPAPGVAAATLAALEDGTPLITMRPVGKGRLVLVHTTANTTWTTLPISGLFVDMLQRILALAPGAGGAPRGLLEPQEVLDGFGRLARPPEPLPAVAAEALSDLVPAPDHPPGLYVPVRAGQEAEGAEPARLALNLQRAVPGLVPLDIAGRGTTLNSYVQASERDLAPPLLTLALLLALADLAIAFALRGLLPRRAGVAASVLVLLALGSAAQAAEDEERLLERANDTRLAYVLTGDAEVDLESEEGLKGLTRVLAQRTAVEAADPAAVDVTADDLALFPLLYWPVPSTHVALEGATVRRVEAYLQQGGMIVFDTRDGETLLPGQEGGPGEERLAEILRTLDLPPLTPLPADHVLTRSFYLLQDFPGRWAGHPVWVDQAAPGINDGVSSVIIGAHEWAGAWAEDDAGEALYSVVPGGEDQREVARRFGVNLVMYALTGNYKTDQVHVPALLERLGQ